MDMEGPRASVCPPSFCAVYISRTTGYAMFQQYKGMHGSAHMGKPFATHTPTVVQKIYQWSTRVCLRSTMFHANFIPGATKTGSMRWVLPPKERGMLWSIQPARFEVDRIYRSAYIRTAT